jgi:hypothetical protein
MRNNQRTSRVTTTLPEHEIVYQGFDILAALDTQLLNGLRHCDTILTKERVTGSTLRDPNPWFYEVVAYPNQ